MPVQTRHPTRSRLSPLTSHLLWSIGVAATIAIVASIWWTIPWLWSWLIGINASTLIAYAYDKTAARQTPQWRRVPEKALHTLGALGGSPAALAGQQLLRHKTIKSSFQIWFWLIFVLQGAIVAVVLWQHR